jgi:hypothetical protein
VVPAGELRCASREGNGMEAKEGVKGSKFQVVAAGRAAGGRGRGVRRVGPTLPLPVLFSTFRRVALRLYPPMYTLTKILACRRIEKNDFFPSRNLDFSFQLRDFRNRVRETF